MRLLERLYGPVTAEASIPAPPSAVYDVLADPETYPDWLVGADHMRGVDPDFPNPGSKFEHSVGPGGALTVDDETESLEADAGPPPRAARQRRALPRPGRLRPAAGPDGGRRSPSPSDRSALFAPLLPLLRPTLHGRNAASLVKLREVVTGARPA